MAYTDIDDSSAYFQVKTYAGTGNAQGITLDGNSDMQPDWVWFKNRTIDSNHALFDSVRGATIVLNSNATTADATEAQMLKSFDSNGFTVGTDSTVNDNDSGTINIVSWNWKAGTSFSNDASSTSVGSVDSTGSVSTDAGFSIINVVKGNTTAHTVAHGLGAVPQMIIGKSRTGSSYRWIVYHQAIGNTHALYLNEDFAKTDSVTFWNDTTPTSSVFSLGTDNSWNGTSIFYCFAEKKGYSKFGSYTGNGNSDGPFFYLGFKPAFVMVKNTAAAKNWYIFNNKTLGFNQRNDYLDANTTDAEENGNNEIDILSNGFKLRSGGTGTNKSGDKYIYMAFAENPFVTSTGVPATAR